MLLKELSSLDASKVKSFDESVPDSIVPAGSLNSHSDLLKVRYELSKLECGYSES